MIDDDFAGIHDLTTVGKTEFASTVALEQPMPLHVEHAGTLRIIASCDLNPAGLVPGVDRGVSVESHERENAGVARDIKTQNAVAVDSVAGDMDHRIFGVVRSQLRKTGDGRARQKTEKISGSLQHVVTRQRIGAARHSYLSGKIRKNRIGQTEKRRALLYENAGAGKRLCDIGRIGDGKFAALDGESSAEIQGLPYPHRTGPPLRQTSVRGNIDLCRDRQHGTVRRKILQHQHSVERFYFSISRLRADGKRRSLATVDHDAPGDYFAAGKVDRRFRPGLLDEIGDGN